MSRSGDIQVKTAGVTDQQESTVKTVPLCQLRPGDRCKLKTTDLHCDDCDLLHAMGLTENCSLRVCRSGEPFIVQVDSTRLGLAASISAGIYVARDETVA